VVDQWKGEMNNLRGILTMPAHNCQEIAGTHENGIAQF
jgi:hypothetical protein